jgi:hypothetical protein
MSKIISLVSIVSFIFCLALFGGCISVDSISSSKAINAELNTKIKPLIDSALIKSRKVIVLETVNESLISSITRILTDNDHLFIFDKKNQKVIIFDNNGKYISNISKKGNGPNEYNQITDVCFDESRKQLIVLCTIPQKLMYFNLSGEFIKENPLSSIYTELKADEKYIYLLNSDYNNNKVSEYSIQTMSKLTNEINSKLPILDNLFGLRSNGKELVSSNGIYFSRMIDNNVYCIKSGSVQPVYKFDFGSSNLNDEYIDKIKNPRKFMDECFTNKYICSISNVVNTKDHLYFCTNLPTIYCLSKGTNNIDQHSTFFDTELRIGKSNFIPVEGSQSKIAVEYNQIFLNRMMNASKFQSKSDITYKKRQELIAKLTAESNPILIIYELK